MNPQTNPNGAVAGLPAPSNEPPVLLPVTPAMAVAAPGQLPPAAAPAPQPPAAATVPLATAPQQAAAVRASPPEGLATPMMAADNDVIEREWVVKAKQVVAATRQDPYKQVKEINKIKADYMKKRYGKDIKLADD